jgi:hypothetical protein
MLVKNRGLVLYVGACCPHGVVVLLYIHAYPIMCTIPSLQDFDNVTDLVGHYQAVPFVVCGSTTLKYAC